MHEEFCAVNGIDNYIHLWPLACTHRFKGIKRRVYAQFILFSNRDTSPKTNGIKGFEHGLSSCLIGGFCIAPSNPPGGRQGGCFRCPDQV
jgi:hypothetical protein